MAQLAEYHRKRNFHITSEPSGRGKTARRRGDSFVIQKHAASHLHYDFRLELDGVLKSWAVPKGPSLDPGIKRLAVEVEDHPLDYAGFEGTIPEGQYGGGEVIVWDRGTWQPEDDAHKQLRKGHLRFALHGEKLHGYWNLVRTRQSGGKPQWLLFKARDEASRDESDYDITEAQPQSVLSGEELPLSAKASKKTWNSNRGDKKSTHAKSPAQKKPKKTVEKTAKKADVTNVEASALPDFIAPQLATLVDKPPTDEQFLFEIKFDGYRALARIEHPKRSRKHALAHVTLHTRNANDWTQKFGRIAKELAKFGVDSAYLDGEIVVLNDQGKSDFQALQNALDERSDTPLHYYVFDLLHLNGYDLRGEPLIRRKDLLKELLRRNPSAHIRYSDHHTGSGKAFLRTACAHHLEGIVCKDGAKPYRAGRSTDWLKVKRTNRQEFVIVGYSDPKGHREHLGALLLGAHESDGTLRYVGRVGTGFSRETLQTLKKQLSALETATPPVFDPPREHDITWVKPKLVGEIQFGNMTHDKVLRQAVFCGLRTDKGAAEVHVETPSHVAKRGKTKPVSKTPRKAPAKAANKAAETVTLTHPEKILFPPDGPTKQELADYYEKVAPRMWRYVEDRPLALLRCPEGFDKECFFHKHVDKDRVEPGIAATSIREHGKKAEYRYLVSPIGLRSLVQLGSLELHLWGARASDVEHPDELVFDLDPAPDVKWSQVVLGAKRVRDLLLRLKLKSFPKLTGGKGIHLHVPIASRYTWPQIESFCQAVAQQLAEDHPAMFLITATKAKRAGKIYLDFRRNQRGSHYVAPFSVRARSGAAIAAPVRWDKLTARLLPNAYTVRTIDKYLTSYTRDPWTNFFKLAQRIALLET